MLTSSVICDVMSVFATRKCQKKKKKKLVKLVNIEEENIHIFRGTWGILMKFSGKMCLMIILKVRENKDFTLSVENTVLK